MQQSDFHDNTIQIGHAHFTPTLTRSAIVQMLTQERENTLESETWMILGSSSQSNWSDIFPLMKVALISCLQMSFGQLQESFFTEISHIRFVNLNQINLYNNQLANIEGILYLDCSQLRKIEFSKNKVIIISKLFSKMYFPKLESIQCQDNKFSETDLGRLYSKNNKMKINMMSQKNRAGAVENANVCAKAPPFAPLTSVNFFRVQPSKSTVGQIKNIKQNRSLGVMMKKIMVQKSKQ